MSKKLFEEFLTKIAEDFDTAKYCLEKSERNGYEIPEELWSYDHPHHEDEFTNLKFGMYIFTHTCGALSCDLRNYDHDEQLETIKKWVNKYD